MMRPRPPMPKLKQATTATMGQVNSSTSISHRARDGSENQVHEHQSVKAASAEEIEGPAGMSGVGLGLTLPGPQGTYLMARIDAFCYFPHANNDDAAKGAMKRASDLVQEQLQAEAAEANEFFKSYRRQ
jgi:hypothetical protein